VPAVSKAKHLNKSSSEIILMRNIDTNKIQSDAKDIVDIDNILTSNNNRRIITATSAPLPRTTLPNTFSNAGGHFAGINAFSVDANGQRRHRNRRQDKAKRTLSQHSKDGYDAKVARLRHELTRSFELMPEKFIKTKHSERRRKNSTSNIGKDIYLG
jgi:tolkin